MDTQIAERLQKLRKEHGYSQEQLADEMGVSRQAVSKWERGEASPDTDNLIALARLYNISVDDLLFEKPAEAEKESRPDAEQDKVERNHHNAVLSIFSSVTVFVCCIVYFLLGGLLDLWHPAWIVFLAIPLTVTLVEAIIKKDANIFCYPVLATGIYLILGFVCGLWHPTWVLFLTIPIYYIIADFIKKK